MKKKQVIIIAVALAVVLLTSTAVYAIGSLSPEDNQANKPVEQPSLSTAAVEAEELQAPLTAEQVDISAYSVPLGTKAEQILRNTLTKKQMTEQEIQYYNTLHDACRRRGSLPRGNKVSSGGKRQPKIHPKIKKLAQRGQRL